MADVSKILVRSNLDLQQNKIYNGGFEVVTALPTADFEGRQVYNSTDSKLYVCKKNTDGTFKWVAVGSNIKTISGATAPTSADMTANDIANNEIFIWQDTTNSKSYLYQNVGGTPRKCGNEDKIQSDLSDLEGRVSANEDAIDTNKTNIATNTANIQTNTDDITALDARVGVNETNIETNTSDITALKTEVDTNKTNIATNTSDIATNKANIETNAENITANATAIENNTKAIKNNTNAIKTNTTNITDLTNNRFKVFTYSIDTLTLNEPMEISFSTINADLTTVGGVTILISTEEQILSTKIDNTNKKITLTSNVTKNNIDLIVYGWVVKTETTTE